MISQVARLIDISLKMFQLVHKGKIVAWKKVTGK